MAGQTGTGKGETVRQERTSARGDSGGSANPTRSKAKQRNGLPARCRRKATPSSGRPHRWMATPPLARATDRIPPTGRLTIPTLSEHAKIASDLHL